MNNPVKMWQDEHARFSRLLDFLDAQMLAFHEGGHPNYELMRDIIHYLKHYADCYHHPREDVAFALLLDREPIHGVVLSAQRHDIGNPLDWLKTNLLFASRDPQMRATLQVTVDELFGRR